MIDGTTDVSDQEQELLYVRVVDGGVPCMRFVSLEHLEKADAASVLRDIESAMDKQVGCPWKTKLVGPATDGVAVMVGKKNGLGALLTRERPQLVTFSVRRIDWN